MILWAIIGFRIEALGFRIQGFMVQDPGFRFRVLMIIKMRNRDV
jgi:hypothetical protein